MNPSALTVPAEADRSGLQRLRWRRALRIAAMAAPIVVLLAVQLHAITRAVNAKLSPAPAALPPLTLPYPYPAAPRPVTVAS